MTCGFFQKISADNASVKGIFEAQLTQTKTASAKANAKLLQCEKAEFKMQQSAICLQQKGESDVCQAAQKKKTMRHNLLGPWLMLAEDTARSAFPIVAL